MARANLQEIVDCFAEGEQGLAEAIADIGTTLACVNRLARALNAEGKDIRSCMMGDYDARFGQVMSGVADQLRALKQIHCDLIRIAERMDLPLPQPKGGGR